MYIPVRRSDGRSDARTLGRTDLMEPMELERSDQITLRAGKFLRSRRKKKGQSFHLSVQPFGWSPALASEKHMAHGMNVQDLLVHTQV